MMNGQPSRQPADGRAISAQPTVVREDAMQGHADIEGNPHDLRGLVEAAQRMAEGDFQKLVTVEARGEVGQLARYINQTMRNLQQLDPELGGSSRRLPQMTGHLSEVVRTTEQASLRVLDEIEQIVEGHAMMDREFQELAALLRTEDGHGAQRHAALETLTRLQELHGRAESRALEIMAAMEFQDITTQRIQKSIAALSEIQARLLRLLVLFNIPPEEGGGTDVAGKWKALSEFATASESRALDQGMVDRLLGEFTQSGR
jgi:chemotaxis regulatin CheY-phosphate phosphatase CheZ